MTWHDYHEATKHSVESLRRTQHVLDWVNIPDPFRHYGGVPVLDLPADPPAPEIAALDVLRASAASRCLETHCRAPAGTHAANGPVHSG
jgi:hypothetical protein